MRNGIFMRAAGTYGPSEPGPVAGQPFLRSRAGPVVRRRAKKVWPSGHRTRPATGLELFFDLFDDAFFQAGDLGLGDTDLPGHFHLGTAVVKPQRQ